MLADTNDRVGLDEAYIIATNTSDLTLREGNCAADHLIAAALSGNRMGDALGHLRSQWDAASKPPKWTEDDVAFRAELVLSVLGMGHKGKPDLKRARTEIMVGYTVRLRHLYLSLPGRSLAMEILSEWAVARGVDHDLLSPALYHWLSPTCPVCDGLGKRRLPDAPVLGKDCHHCAGTGKWPRPLGSERVAHFIKGCVGRSRQERRNLLRGPD